MGLTLFGLSHLTELLYCGTSSRPFCQRQNFILLPCIASSCVLETYEVISPRGRKKSSRSYPSRVWLVKSRDVAPVLGPLVWAVSIGCLNWCRASEAF